MIDHGSVDREKLLVGQVGVGPSTGDQWGRRYPLLRPARRDAKGEKINVLPSHLDSTQVSPHRGASLGRG